MLIKIFGIWLIASNIAYLQPYKNSSCFIMYPGNRNVSIEIDQTCDQVAEEINKQVKNAK